MLSNAYFLAKFRFDTAKNEPAKNLQNFAKFANLVRTPSPAPSRKGSAADLPADALLGDAAEVPGRLHLVHAGVARLAVPAQEIKE